MAVQQMSNQELPDLTPLKNQTCQCSGNETWNEPANIPEKMKPPARDGGFLGSNSMRLPWADRIAKSLGFCSSQPGRGFSVRFGFPVGNLVSSLPSEVAKSKKNKKSHRTVHLSTVKAREVSFPALHKSGFPKHVPNGSFTTKTSLLLVW